MSLSQQNRSRAPSKHSQNQRQRASTASNDNNAVKPDSSIIDIESKDGEDFSYWENLSTDDALAQLDASSSGLTSDQAKQRLKRDGPNDIESHEASRLARFCSFLWNPLSWAMEVSVILAIVLEDWPDAILVVVLLLANAAIGYYEETNAGDAIAALMDHLAPVCRVTRDGNTVEVPGAELVAGDIIAIRLGDVVPADCKLLGDCTMLIDQASLTGESEPQKKQIGDVCFSGSMVKKGETEALVFATGERTFFGQAVSLLNGVEEKGSLQIVLTKIGNFCISIIFVMVILELIAQFAFRSQPCSLWMFGQANNCSALNNVLVLIIGGIPIAMPTVLSVTMALGAMALGRKDAIVTRLTAIEELASMDILCSDKTGTLTLNELTIKHDLTLAVNSHTDEEVMFYAAASAKPENGEPIDVCTFDACEQKDTMWDELELLNYVPFDPVGKRTIASIRVRSNGNTFRACKGAPWVVLEMDANVDEIRSDVEQHIKGLAERGYRSLGVAVSRDATEVPLEECRWEMVGVIAMQDPPRHDSGDTIKELRKLGVSVKMITGDQLAIGVETCNQLGIPSNLLTAEELQSSSDERLVETADGFAEVYPQHKYDIVQKLQKLNHVTGMTGDGVNDAPALKRADIGIAVADSTDAARAAADIVLLTPGLSVILDAIVSSRRIFQRMSSYAVYSVSMTVRIILSFGLLTILFDWYFPSLVIVILAILNDGTILTISKDNAESAKKPVRWSLNSIFTQALFYGSWLSLGTLCLFALTFKSDFVSDTLGLDSLREMPIDCDRNRNWQSVSLASCDPFDLVIPSGITYEQSIEAAFATIGTPTPAQEQCKDSLAQEICYLEQKRAGKMRGLIYIFVSVTGQATIFVTRTQGHSFKGGPALPLVLAFVVAQVIATCIGAIGLGGFITDPRTLFLGCSWGWAAFAWFWAILWYIPLDFIKKALIKSLGKMKMSKDNDKSQINTAQRNSQTLRSTSPRKSSATSSRVRSRTASQRRASAEHNAAPTSSPSNRGSQQQQQQSPRSPANGQTSPTSPTHTNTNSPTAQRS